jgi:4-amino-4-deoxy-L-arabinose transferase-like glycosyltransferase
VGGIAQRIPRGAALLVVAAAALPRLLALAIEREQILEAYVEKSDVFARTLVSSGTFGFLPEVPSAYTQPLYAWFLAGLYWPLDRSWVVVGLAQVLVAVVTALLALAIGTHLASVRTGVLAALVATLHPYLVWHDIHVNREILDGLLAAAIVLLALLAYERRSLPPALALGAVTGLAILSNARLLLLPLVLAPYVAWRVRPAGRAIAAAALVLVGAALVTAPWVVRNKVVIGCATITTDTRALWKANNPATYDVLARGGWIDDVPDLRGVPPWPEKAAGISVAAAKAVDECAQSSFYRDEVFDFWRDHPGEKARLAVQAVGMLWSPFLSVTADDAAQQGASDLAQRTVEPAFVLLLYAFALWGAFLAPRRFVALAALLLGFNTLMAMVFAGTVRYRAPWDFVLALLAAFALERAWELLLRKRRSPPAANAVP